MSAVAQNNAFGPGSPSWNVTFPDGNLTVAEILAYLPHWLKSQDVILRLTAHGGRSVIITHLLNKYRTMPLGKFAPNSTTVMIHYAMRRVSSPKWTIGTRDKYKYDREYDENSVYVGDFRPPRITHPKSAPRKHKTPRERMARNWAVDPIPFKELALHVKEHPSGDDALDLARCVNYALENPDEKWLFPVDFVKLVKHLGGPRSVTYAHLDRQLFARYNHLYTAHTANRMAWGKRKANDSESEAEIDSESEGGGENAQATFEPMPKRRKAPNTASANKSVTRHSHSALTNMLSSPARNPIPDEVDGSQKSGDGKRRSSRRVNKAPVYVEKDEEATDTEAVDADSTPLRKKRKLTRIPSTLKKEESDFEAKDEPESEDELLPVEHDAAEDLDFGTPTGARGRRTASHKARKSISEQSSAAIIQQFEAARAAARPAHRTFADYSPTMMAAARAYGTRTPIFVPPPVLSADRLVIDMFTVYIYAQEGCRNDSELWASALSFYRFAGPRRHAPFRELYRLTEPYDWDTSDWAENVRWAKEQYKYFGVETWSEYDDHLERITQWRRQSLWVSEQTVVAGNWRG